MANFPGKLKFLDDKYITLADIPGLIEGSSQNKGLGFEFLKHVERTKALCFVIDMSNTHEKAPWDQFTILQNELTQYSSSLGSKEMIIVGNKADLKGAYSNYEEFARRVGRSPIMVSGKESEGLEHLVVDLRRRLLAA